MGNCLNLDSADKSDKDRYFENLIYLFNLIQSWFRQDEHPIYIPSVSGFINENKKAKIKKGRANLR